MESNHAYEMPAESTSRARLLAQERDKQLQRYQQNQNTNNVEKMSTENEREGSTFTSHHGQFTPAIRQFSTPKGVAESYLNEEDVAAEKPKFPAKPTIFRAFTATSISIGEDGSDSHATKNPPLVGAYTRRNRPPLPAQRNAAHEPSKSRVSRLPSGPAPQSYHRSRLHESVDSERDSSRASTLSTDDDDDDEGEKSRVDVSHHLTHQNDEENDDEDEREESKESEERLDDCHSHLLTGSPETDSPCDFKLSPVPDPREAYEDSHAFVDKKTLSSFRDPREEEGNPMTPPSSVARPLRVFHGFDLSDMKKFLMSPIPKEAGVVQCYIKRKRTGMNKLYPIYSVYLKDGDRFLMSSRKRPNNKTSNYLVSMSEDDMSRDGGNYLGKLRSNFVGTEFQMFDDGVNPKDAEDMKNLSAIRSGLGPGGNSDGSQSKLPVNRDARRELGAVIYAANVLGSRDPRKMQVAIPEVDELNLQVPTRRSRNSVTSTTADSSTRRSRTSSLANIARRFSFSSTMDTAVPTEDGSPREYDDLLGMMKDRCYRDLNYYINKPPRWNDQVGAYVLNFGGRVTMASVKNFQLCDPDEPDDVALQFGRVGKEDFTMDLKWPLSPFQAFAITLSSFDSKIACD